jgi:hypothetical protein
LARGAGPVETGVSADGAITGRPDLVFRSEVSIAVSAGRTDPTIIHSHRSDRGRFPYEPQSAD